MEQQTTTLADIDSKIAGLLQRMTLSEKIGQLCVVDSGVDHSSDQFRQSLIEGRVGAIINQVDRSIVVELQQIAKSRSRHGIPLLVGRDVVHGFKTVFPIPLGLAATWNPDLVKQAARVAALEASQAGVNWTYAPVLDIARDPRWGRVAESFGEDPYLTSVLGVAMVAGFQGDVLSEPGNIAACVKHFAGYGASEGGRDYNTTNIPENELRNVHLPPFKAAFDAGAASVMASFSDLNGVPATANRFLLRQILREEWGFDGVVVSDWDAIVQLSVHGLTTDDKDSARRAASAGVDMEMSSTAFLEHLSTLIDEGEITVSQIDKMVARILRIKFRLGLFENPCQEPVPSLDELQPTPLTLAKELASQSIVLLTNRNRVLPLKANALRSIAVVGPLADDGYEQLGTWVFDGDPRLSQTPLAALRRYVDASTQVRYVRAMDSSRSKGNGQFKEAVELVREADVALLFLGEESILSGEAHCRADISLPGNQEQLIEAIAATGTPVVLVLMTGRPLALQRIVDKVDAILCAWHPGNMAGPAIVDLLFGEESPSGKLPITFPRVTGQIPIYYGHKNTGRPPTRKTVVNIDNIESGAPQHSVGNTSFHLDVEPTPLFAFGHGLSYTEFAYENLRISPERIRIGDDFTVSVDLKNTGDMAATEVVQLYIRDLVGSVTRPVKELKRFKRCHLGPGDATSVTFELNTCDLAFCGPDQKLVTEPGDFHLWVGGSSDIELRTEFELID